MNKGIIVILTLLVFLAMPIVSAQSEYCLVPKDSNVSAGGDTVEVELWLDATDPAASGVVRINYTYCCANITSYTADKTFFEDVGIVRTDGQLNIGFAHFDSATSLPANQPVGSYHLGNLTIECCSGDCMTDLLLVDCELFDWYGYGPAGSLPFLTTNGTFTCGEPVESECLGDCYNATGTLIASDVPCYECIGVGTDVSWENYEFDSPCSPGTTVPRRPYDYCPECCDGVNNDGDNLIDWPADPECACCLDETEAVDEGCPVECVPELPTLALAGIGILGIALLARKRD